MLQKTKRSEYIKTYGEQWADDLPENCPPEDVFIPNNELFYRMTQNDDRTVPEDWVNYLTLFPNVKYSKEQRVYAAGLSIMNSQEAVENKMRLPWIKKKGFKGIAMISLLPEDGVVLQTTNEINHYTWWRTKMFNIKKAKMI